MELRADKIISEHYKLTKSLGQGSFGDVWLAHNMLADIDVAIKFYGMLDQHGLEEFRNEFRIAYELRHPNLLNINHFDIFEDCPYLVMPYCARGSVSPMTGHMSEKELWRFVADVSAGLAFLHSQHPAIIHQDIKPANILISSDGHYVITDFGISRRLMTRMSQKSNADISSGTIAYMSPERLADNPYIVPASDIWALGATVYEIMKDRLLWEGYAGYRQQHDTKPPVIDADYSEELKSLVVACLAANPDDRPTATEVSRYATAHINGTPLPQLKSVLKKQERSQFQATNLMHNNGNSQSSNGYSQSNNGYGQRNNSYGHISNGYKQAVSYNYNYQNSNNHSAGSSHSNHTALKKEDNNLRRILLITACAIIGLLIITGGYIFFSSLSEQRDWVSCRTKQDFEQFLKKHPKSEHAENARQRIANMTPKPVEEQSTPQQPVQHTLIQEVPPPATVSVQRQERQQSHTSNELRPQRPTRRQLSDTDNAEDEEEEDKEETSKPREIYIISDGLNSSMKVERHRRRR